MTKFENSIFSLVNEEQRTLLDQKFMSFLKTNHFTKEKAKEILFTLKELFSKYEIDFFLVFGTLLGAQREKNFIEGDHDVDIAIKKHNETKLVQLLKSNDLITAGFVLGRIHSKGELVSLIKNNTYIDIYIFSENNIDYGCCDYYHIKKSQLDKYSEILFLGSKFLTVCNPEEYLTDKYGDWKTPKNKAAIS